MKFKSIVALFAAFFLSLLFSLVALCETTAYSVSSPDGKITFSISKSETSMPAYSISYVDQLLISNGQLGLKFSDWTFGTEAQMLQAQSSQGRETYKLISGKASEIDEPYNLLTVPFVQNERLVNIEIKVFDSGLGFRYVFPEQKAWTSYLLLDELTTYNLQDNPQSLVMYLENYTTSHENLYDSIDYDSLKQEALIEMPALFGVALPFCTKVPISIKNPSLPL